MEWVIRLNRALKYIEDNLTAEICESELEKILACSFYQFQRMFSYMADVSLSEYIRRRKMTKAAADLQKTDLKIIDIANAYGYNSPTAFTRAFIAFHGISPSTAKEQGIELKSYPPISFNVMIKGHTELKYRIESKEKFKVIGVTTPISADIEKNFDAVEKLWSESYLNGNLQRIIHLNKATSFELLGVCTWGRKDGGKYFIAVKSDENADEFQEYCIPKATYAIFTGFGKLPDAMQELEKQIFTEWLPTSGYEYGDNPDIELYKSLDRENTDFEIWISIK